LRCKDAHQGRNYERDGQTIEKRYTPAVEHHYSHITAQHRECTMGEIDKIHDAEGDAQTEGEQEKQRAERDSIEKNRQHGIPPAGLSILT
jgi:hypothetical protein